MRINKTIFVLLLISIFFVSGCFQEKTIEIGFVGSLSGSSFELGLPAKNGFILGVEEINKNGGINGQKIIPIIKDDQSDPTLAYDIGLEFADEDVTFVVGHLTSNMLDGVFKTLEEKDMFYISPTMSTSLLGNIDDSFFSVNTVSDTEADGHYEILVKRNPAKRVAVIYDIGNKAFTEPIFKRFEKQYIESGGEIVYVNTLDTEIKDYATIVDEIIESKADGLMLITNTVDTSNILQQLGKNKYPIVRTITGWSMNEDLITRSGKSVEGAYVISSHHVDLERENYQVFLEKYKERFKQEPAFSSHFAYDAITVLGQGLSESKEATPEDVKKKLIEIGSVEGVQSDISINKFGDTMRTMNIIQVKDGEFVEIGAIQPQK